jgi:hypothetical protein
MKRLTQPRALSFSLSFSLPRRFDFLIERPCCAAARALADRGETAHGWPDVSSKYGMIDLAGFEKDQGGYYKAFDILTTPLNTPT